MKLTNDLDAAGNRIKNQADPVDDSDVLTAMSLAPMKIPDGRTFRVPAHAQVLYVLPIESEGTGSIELDGALVEA